MSARSNIDSCGCGLESLPPSLHRTWTLELARTTFGPDGPPSAGTVRWTEHGLVVALVFASGYVYADGVITGDGCALIGLPSGYTCSIVSMTPKHVRCTARISTIAHQ